MVTPPLPNQGFLPHRPLKVAPQEPAIPTGEDLPRCLPKCKRPLDEAAVVRIVRPGVFTP